MDMHKMTPWNWLRRENNPDQPLPRQARHPLLLWDREIDNWFEKMLGDMAWTTPAPRANSALTFQPNLEILEQDDHYLISAEIPGVEKQDLEVSLDNDRLMISGHKKDEQESEKDGYHYSERRYGSFQRMLALPADADGDQMNAVFHNGVLSLTIPRHSEHGHSRKKIEIH